jgi:pSer/pThr/pTyr-binding forkhead associated (FHA) protein
MVERTELLGDQEIHVAWLLILGGPRRGRDYRLQKVTNIGRDSKANEIILDDEAVSAEHARIRYENGAYVLYDLASSNGTVLNGKRTQKAILRDEDRIEIGHITLLFKEARVA